MSCKSCGERLESAEKLTGDVALEAELDLPKGARTEVREARPFRASSGIRQVSQVKFHSRNSVRCCDGTRLGSLANSGLGPGFAH